jgi:uncharacterized membrane protein YkvA (DUF1232 family)
VRERVTAHIAALRDLIRDPGLARRHKVALWLLLAYLLNPIDLIPDVIPVIGYLDDVVIAALVLRWVAKGREPQEEASEELRSPTRT